MGHSEGMLEPLPGRTGRPRLQMACPPRTPESQRVARGPPMMGRDSVPTQAVTPKMAAARNICRKDHRAVIRHNSILTNNASPCRVERPGIKPPPFLSHGPSALYLPEQQQPTQTGGCFSLS
ncbi:unnamed protein product [Pleuronectes platessa]|uniref:Uncharacterized protein n=1 Tax=Pleuronectes platessa TaxID=8262 RepID=A0A9N7UX76_PLEPL|nr:unnamed protein product [Pleuronectes platessa]